MCFKIGKWSVVGLAMSVAMAVTAAPMRNVAGAGMGGNSPYATDAYPGFDGLDDIPRPERREKSWFLSVKRETAAEQYKMAEELESLGEYKDAAKAFDALVREWPASPEAPRAQLRFATLLASKLDEYEDAFDQLEYLLDFYPKDCPYLEIVEKEYQLVNLMVKTRKSFLGLSFLSNRLVRQHYESIVRRAPAAAYVPEAMLRIADLREQDSHYEEAVKVYANLASKFPKSDEARLATYLEARARMWLCRRLAYNIPRCKDTVGYLKMAQKRFPDLEQIDELKTWEGELMSYLAEDAFKRAQFYDALQRTRHAAIAAWKQYLRDYPESVHEQDVRNRIEELQSGAKLGTFKESGANEADPSEADKEGKVEK